MVKIIIVEYLYTLYNKDRFKLTSDMGRFVIAIIWPWRPSLVTTTRLIQDFNTHKKSASN